MFDERLYRDRVHRAQLRLSPTDPVRNILRTVADHLNNAMATLTVPVPRALVISPWDEYVRTPHLQHRTAVATLADCPTPPPTSSSHLTPHHTTTARGSAAAGDDVAPFSADLLVAFLVDHCQTNVVESLRRYAQILRPHDGSSASVGILYGSFYGGHAGATMATAFAKTDLQEYSGVSPRLSPRITPQDWTGLLGAAGFAEVVVTSDVYHVTYPTLATAMQDVRRLGEANCMNGRRLAFTTRRYFRYLEEELKQPEYQLYDASFSSGRAGEANPDHRQGAFHMPLEIITYHAVLHR